MLVVTGKSHRLVASSAALSFSSEDYRDWTNQSVVLKQNGKNLIDP